MNIGCRAAVGAMDVSGFRPRVLLRPNADALKSDCNSEINLTRCLPRRPAPSAVERKSPPRESPSRPFCGDSGGRKWRARRVEVHRSRETDPAGGRRASPVRRVGRVCLRQGSGEAASVSAGAIGRSTVDRTGGQALADGRSRGVGNDPRSQVPCPGRHSPGKNRLNFRDFLATPHGPIMLLP